MFGIFKNKSEDKRKLGDWGRLKKCKECDRLQKPFAGDFPEDVCPECGSGSVEVVTARWEWSIEMSAFHGRMVLHRSEIRGIE